METTVRKLSEQIQRLYARGLSRDDVSPLTDKREISLLVQQVANRILKMQAYEPKTKGINLPPCSIATYQNIPVTDVTAGQTTAYSYAAIPVTPIHLPMEMGIWQVCDQRDIFNPFIPLVGADSAVMNGTRAAWVEGQKCYKVEGQRVIFLGAIAAAVPTVQMKLLVYNITDITSVLPITADQQEEIIRGVLELLGAGSISQYELNKEEEQKRQIEQS